MTKNEFITMMHNQGAFATRSEADRALKAVLNTLGQCLQNGHAINFSGFGRFEVTSRSAHYGHNPRTGTPMFIPATCQVTFKPGKLLRQAINSAT